MIGLKQYLDKFSKGINDSSITAEWEPFGDSLLEPLLNFLKMGTSYEKYNATNVIRQMWFLGKYHQWILEYAGEPMIWNLQDEYEYTRGITVAVLSDFRDKRALEPIISLANDSSDYVRWVIAWCLGRFDDMRAIPVLEWIRDNDNSWQRVRDDNEEEGYRKEFNRDAAIETIAKLQKSTSKIN